MEGVKDMKKKPVRIISLILAIVMVVAMLPLSALAETETRKVGVVVYGSELTAILAYTDKTIKDGVANMQNGDAEAAVEGVKSSLETLMELATSLSTGAIDGTGFSVPDLDLKVEDSNGRTYSLTEQPVEIFSQTAEVQIPFEDELEETLDTLEVKLVELRDILSTWEPLKVDPLQINKLINDTADKTKEIDFVKVTDDLTKLVNDFVGDIAKLTGFEGKLYRTYVVDKPLNVGETYSAYITGFVDVDENNNPITRDGYMVFNDGLENGSMFNTTRSFEFEVKHRGRFDHEIQFVGPKAGIEGSIEFPKELTDGYDKIAGMINSLSKVLNDAKAKVNDNIIAEAIKAALTAAFDAQELLEWFDNWDPFVLKTSDQLGTKYEFTFPGIWCAEADAGFTFKNADVAENSLRDSEFLLINREEAIDVLKLMLDLGKEAFTAALKANFGYTDEESGERHEGMLKLYGQLLKSEDGQINIDADIAYQIIENYVAVIAQMELMDKIVDTQTNDIVPVKLRYPLPAILTATTDPETGLVEFTKNSNKTLTWMLEIVDKLVAYAGTSLEGKNDMLDILLKVSAYASDISKRFVGDIINTLVYPFAQRLGIVGQKFGSGTYVMFQIKAPTDAEGNEYWVNPFAYTMIIKWQDNWCYATVADLGIVAPYFAEGFYDFIRNTTFAGTIDKYLNQVLGKDANIITGILTDKLDLNETALGALTAFVGAVGFDTFNLDSLFANKSEFIAGLNQYLLDNGRTAQNLMVYLNKQVQKAKSVYAGDLDPVKVVAKDGTETLEYWTIYNLNKSPTLTATKLIDKSTKNISEAFVNQTKAGIVSNTGKTVSKVVNAVGTKVEETVQNIKTQIKSTIGVALKGLADKALNSVKEAAISFVKGLFSRFFGSGMITFNA